MQKKEIEKIYIGKISKLKKSDKAYLEDNSPLVSDRDYDDIKIYVDPHSAFILRDVVVDYIVSFQHRGFSFNTPNANTTCGCGSSFS